MSNSSKLEGLVALVIVIPGGARSVACGGLNRIANKSGRDGTEGSNGTDGADGIDGRLRMALGAQLGPRLLLETVFRWQMASSATFRPLKPLLAEPASGWRESIGTVGAHGAACSGTAMDPSVFALPFPLLFPLAPLRALPEFSLRFCLSPTSSLPLTPLSLLGPTTRASISALVTSSSPSRVSGWSILHFNSEAGSRAQSDGVGLENRGQSTSALETWDLKELSVSDLLLSGTASFG